MRINIPGIIDKIGKVESGVGKKRDYFRQLVVLEQPERLDEFQRVIHRAQYYPIVILSNKLTDSRFLTAKDIRSKKTASVALYGDRWFNQKEFQYALRLMLSEWTK